MALMDSSQLTATVPEKNLDWALLQFFRSHAEQSEELVGNRKMALAQCSPGTFGYALNTYYLANQSLPFPGSPDSLFPQDYLALHDSHHVLLGSKTDEAGEVYVTAFECGLMSGSEARVLIVLAQIQLLLEHRGIELFDAVLAAESFKIGQQTNRALLDRFDPWESLAVPIDTLREDLGLVPLSIVWG